MCEKRIKKLQNLFSFSNIDAFLVTNFYNILYFSGFKTLVPHEREAFLLVTKNNLYILSDGRYVGNIQYPISNDQFPISKQEPNSNKPIFKLLSPEKGLIKNLQEIITEEKISKLGFEKEDLKWSEYNTFQKTLKVELVSLDKAGVQIRAIKEKEEVEKIQKACKIGDGCLRDISPLIRMGMTEKEIAWKIEKWIREKGHEIAFDPIVAVDKNSAVPHFDTKNGSRVIKDNSVILIDMGVSYQGYNSDITRMFFIGKQPDEVIKTYNALLSAQTATIQHISTVKKLSELDQFCREDVTRYMLHDTSYPHSTGHGVGLEVHEYPKVSTVSDDTLQPGQVFTIEPGIYIPNKWGMRIEDTVVINSLDPRLRGDDKQIKMLTAYPKAFQVL